MLISRFHAILLALFWAFTTAVGDDTTPACDDTAGVRENDAKNVATKVLYFDDEANVYPETLWDEVGMDDVIAVAFADRGIWTFRFKRSLFHELVHGSTEFSGLQSTFFQQSKLFIDTLDEPIRFDYEQKERVKTLGQFQKACIISKSTKGTKVKDSLPMNLEFITAIARLLKEITNLEWSQIQWLMSSSSAKRAKLNVQLRKIGSGGIFSLVYGKKYLAENVKWSKGDSLVFGNGPSPFKTLAAFSKEEEEKEKENPSALTVAQQVYYGLLGKVKYTPPVDLVKTYERESPQAKSLQLLGSHSARIQRFRNDDNTKPFNLMIMVITTRTAWILMLPESLTKTVLSRKLMSNTVQEIRWDPWFQSKIKEPVLDLWKRDKTRSTEDKTPVHIQVLIPVKSIKFGLLADAILEEIAALGIGPLKDNLKSLKKSTTSYLTSDRLLSGPDRFLAPKTFFVIENTYAEKRTHDGEKKSVSVLTVSYGAETLFKLTFDSTNGRFELENYFRI